MQELPNRVLLGGAFVSLDVEGGTGVIDYSPPKEMLNPAGAVQGGFLCAIIDDVAGFVTYMCCGERMFSTLTLTTTFLRPAFANTVIRGTTTVIQNGKRQAVVDTELTDAASGKVIARATQVQVFVG